MVEKKIAKAGNYNFKYVDCDFCGSNDTIFIGSREAFSDFKNPHEKINIDIFKCRKCGLIYPNPLPLPDEKQFQLNYSEPEKYFPFQVDERIKCYESILKPMARFKTSKGRLLDVGCGRGELVFAAKKLGWDAYGIDPSAAFIKYANEKLCVDVKQGRLDEFSFPDKHFDAICLGEVLQYVDTPKKLLMEVSRIIKKNGIIYVEDTNTDALVLMLGDLFFRFLGKNKTTRIYPGIPKFETFGFSVKALSAYLKQAGFKILICKVWGGTAGVPRLKKCFISDLLCFIRKIVVVIGRLIGKGNVISIYAVKS